MIVGWAGDVGGGWRWVRRVGRWFVNLVGWRCRWLDGDGDGDDGGGSGWLWWWC